MDYIKEAFAFADRFRNMETYEDLGNSIYIGIVYKPIFNKLTWIKLSRHTVLVGPNGGGKSKIIQLLVNYFSQFNLSTVNQYDESMAFDFICMISQSGIVDHTLTGLFCEANDSSYTLEEIDAYYQGFGQFIAMPISALKDNILINFSNDIYHSNSTYFNDFIDIHNPTYSYNDFTQQLIDIDIQDMFNVIFKPIENNIDKTQLKKENYILIDDIMDNFRNEHEYNIGFNKIFEESLILSILYDNINYYKHFLTENSIVFNRNIFKIEDMYYPIYFYMMPFVRTIHYFRNNFYISSTRTKNDINDFYVKKDVFSNIDNLNALNKWLEFLGLNYKLLGPGEFEYEGHRYPARIYALKNNKEVHEFKHLSHGHAQLIELLYRLSFTHSNSKLVILENIEAYLHPKLLTNIIDLLVVEFTLESYQLHLSDENATPVVSYSSFIYETQSDILIKSFQLLVARKKLSPRNITVNYINNESESRVINILVNGDLSYPIPDEFIELGLDLIINRMSKN